MPFPPATYVRNFLPTQTLNTLYEKQEVGLFSNPPSSSSAPGLSIETYQRHWADVLCWELDVLASEKEQIILWELGISVADWDTSEFLLYVPGIRENYPRLEIGDLVRMRG